MVYAFQTQVSYEDIRFHLVSARQLGVVYFLVFGSAADLFQVVNVAAVEKIFFECTRFCRLCRSLGILENHFANCSSVDIWIATDRSLLASDDFAEIYNRERPDTTYFSGALAVMPPPAQVASLFRALQTMNPQVCVGPKRLFLPPRLTFAFCFFFLAWESLFRFNLNKKRNGELFADIDDRVVLVHDFVRAVGFTIGNMIQQGLDPLVATGSLPYFNTTARILPFVLNSSADFIGASGRFSFNIHNLRDGEIGIFNWRVLNSSTTTWKRLATYASGRLAWQSATLKSNIRWTSSTPIDASSDTWKQPEQLESRTLRVGVTFRTATYRAPSAEWLVALDWATDYINKNILSYYQFTYNHIDLGVDTATSVRALRQWMEGNDPVVLVGPVTTSLATAMIPLAQEAGVPMISPSAPGESLSNSFYYKGFTRVSDSDANWARAFFGFMRRMRWTTFAAISSTDDDRVIDEVVAKLPSDFRMSSRASFEFFSPSYVDFGIRFSPFLMPSH